MGRGVAVVSELVLPKSATATAAAALPLLALNHVSFICKSVTKSVQFYEQVLDFVLIKRPSSFDFEGAWLFNHGIGIHLLQAVENNNNNNNNNEPAAAAQKKEKKINPKDNHISFQCTDMNLIIRQLEEMKIEYVTAVVSEGGIIVDQLFFHDPDGYMIEICNCQNIPVLPLAAASSSCPLKNQISNNLTPTPSYHHGEMQNCSGEVEALMMENLAINMLNFSI